MGEWTANDIEARFFSLLSWTASHDTAERDFFARHSLNYYLTTNGSKNERLLFINFNNRKLFCIELEMSTKVGSFGSGLSCHVDHGFISKLDHHKVIPRIFRGVGSNRLA
jgi:hypothetical protein